MKNYYQSPNSGSVSDSKPAQNPATKSSNNPRIYKLGIAPKDYDKSDDQTSYYTSPYLSNLKAGKYASTDKKLTRLDDDRDNDDDREDDDRQDDDREDDDREDDDREDDDREDDDRQDDRDDDLDDDNRQDDDRDDDDQDK
ncbi:hypothetical protein MSG28_015539 [Choristoneura fumiferana]|uniref:Uncharacterized protein n=1 Tax=Choristoneura fumiferana TaxID=7141 RepID=A0ACC0KAG4_CHOFU|nr:hypothetical protein MSG28_015539 [Choristoneura fumiferana]